MAPRFFGPGRRLWFKWRRKIGVFLFLALAQALALVRKRGRGPKEKNSVPLLVWFIPQDGDLLIFWAEMFAAMQKGGILQMQNAWNLLAKWVQKRLFIPRKEVQGDSLCRAYVDFQRDWGQGAGALALHLVAFGGAQRGG